MGLSPASTYIELNQLHFRYLDFGSPGLPPLVFLHGTGLHAWMWLPFAEALKDSFRCYALDQRGHGDSDKAPGNYSWATMADDFAAFLDALKIKSPLCVGHSMGGTVALLAEARHPGLLGRAVLLDPIVLPPIIYTIPPTVENQPLAAKTIKRREVWDSRDQMIESYSRKLPFKAWKPDQLKLYVDYGTEELPDGRVKLKCPAAIEAKCYIGGSMTDPWPLLPNIQTPTLILRGSESDTARVIESEKIARTLPRGSFREIPGATHFLPMDDPDAVIREILDFFKGKDELQRA